MQIGEVIREHRRRLGLTQEQVADRLGVTAPAVNKWERGVTTPDIGLLSPIARLLEVSLEELLSFREELSAAETAELIQEADRRFSEGGYDEAYAWVRQTLAQWPNCEALTLSLAELLASWSRIRELPGDRERDRYITDCYIRLLESRDEDIRRQVAQALFRLHMWWGEYGGAEAFLRHFSRYDPLGKLLRGQVLAKTDRTEEALKTWEELLFQSRELLNMTFAQLYAQALEAGDAPRARMLADKQCTLAALFEMGEFQTLAPKLELTLAERDPDRAIDLLEKLLESVPAMDGAARSPLYAHMTFKSLDPAFYDGVRESLLSVADEDKGAFLRDEPRWKALRERYRTMS